jgi:hypothetical protein
MNPSWMLGCFFCGVDSRSLLFFFIVFVTSLVLASICFLLWAINRGDFTHLEQTKYDVFKDPEAGVPGTVPVPPPSSGQPN